MNKHIDAEDHNGYISSKTYHEGVIPGLEDKKEKINDIIDFLENFIDKVDEIIDAIEHSNAVEDCDHTFICEPEKLNHYIRNLKEIININNQDYKAIYNLTNYYIDWERSVTQKLDNPDANLGDTFEEIKQSDDEFVFRHNKKIMNSLDDKLVSIANGNFNKYILNIEKIQSKLKKLDVLEEIAEIGELFSSVAKLGTLNSGSSSINTLTMSDIDDYTYTKFELDFVNIMDHFKNGSILVITGVTISDEILQKINNSKLFKIAIDGNGYKVTLEYLDIEKYIIDNPNITIKLLEDAMENGVGGIYKRDPKTGKWYTIDTDGNIKYFTELPDSISKSLTKVNEVLGPLGIVIDVAAMSQALASGDISEILSTGGGIVGGVATTFGIAKFIKNSGLIIESGGLYLLVIIGANLFGGMLGEFFGTTVDEIIEGLVRDEKIYWV